MHRTPPARPCDRTSADIHPTLPRPKLLEAQVGENEWRTEDHLLGYFIGCAADVSQRCIKLWPSADAATHSSSQVTSFVTAWAC